MKKLALAALMLLTPTTAIAENSPTWTVVPGTSGMYVRKTDIWAGRSYQTYAQLWMKFDLTDPQGGFKGTGMVRYNVNCPAQTFQKMNHAYYMANGEILRSNTLENIESVIPGSKMEVVLMALCSDSGKY